MKEKHVIHSVQVTVLPDGRMDTPNTAAYLGVRPKTLAQWRSMGIGPNYIKRGRIFYFRADLDMWLADGGQKRG